MCIVYSFWMVIKREFLGRMTKKEAAPVNRNLENVHCFLALITNFASYI